MIKKINGSIFIVLCVLSNFVSQVYFDAISKSTLKVFEFGWGQIPNLIQALLADSRFYLAFFFYALSAVFWLLGLKKMALSRAFAITSLNYVLITIFSLTILAEGVTTEKILSCILISIGIVIMNLNGSELKKTVHH